MADDMVVLQCEACTTRLKIRAVTARIMKEVKCPKCGRKVLTKNVVASTDVAPQSAAPSAPVVPETPAEVAASVPPPPPPAPVVVSPVTAPITTAATPSVSVDSDELKQARARIANLESQLQLLEARVVDLNAAAAATATTDVELARARKLLAEQEERLAQLQQMWYEKEKEARTATAAAQRAQQERKATLDQLEGLLKSYHEAEIDAATERINNLNTRLQSFLAQQTAPRPVVGA